MFVKYPKTKRILVPQVNIKGKQFLSDAETKLLLGGKVQVFEKIDGANTGVRRVGNYFKLQKRGSLVGQSEHFQFQYFFNWSNYNYDKIMGIPEDHILYGELMVCQHHIYYDQLPDWFIPFGLFDVKKSKFLSYEELKDLCDNIGLHTVPLLFEGHITKMELFDLIPKVSHFSSNKKAEGIVVQNYKHQLIGKVVREEFVKELDEEDHWTNQPVRLNRIKE